MTKDIDDKTQAAQMIRFLYQSVQVENTFSWRSVLLENNELFVYVFVEPIKGDSIKLICNASGENIYIFFTELSVEEVVPVLIGMHQKLEPAYGKVFSLGECKFVTKGYPYGLILLPETLGLLEKLPHHANFSLEEKKFYLFMAINEREHQIVKDHSLDELLDFFEETDRVLFV